MTSVIAAFCGFVFFLHKFLSFFVGFHVVECTPELFAVGLGFIFHCLAVVLDLSIDDSAIGGRAA
jgi:hypothetical protein